MEVFKMTEKQKELLTRLSKLYMELNEACADEDFHDVMIENNDLFPLSLDEMSAQWLTVADGEVRIRIEQY